MAHIASFVAHTSKLKSKQVRPVRFQTIFNSAHRQETNSASTAQCFVDSLKRAPPETFTKCPIDGTTTCKEIAIDSLLGRIDSMCVHVPDFPKW